MNSYNFFTTSTNCKFSHYGPLNIDSNLRPHQMVRHSSSGSVKREERRKNKEVQFLSANYGNQIYGNFKVFDRL